MENFYASLVSLVSIGIGEKFPRYSKAASQIVDIAYISQYGPALLSPKKLKCGKSIPVRFDECS
jgi:hypothetical protein